MTVASLELCNISFGFTHRQLFKDLNLAFYANQHCAILGANGAGKSSLFHLASAALTAHKGYVYIHQQSNLDWSPRDLANCLAVLPQHSSLSFGFSVFELIALGLQNQRLSYVEQKRVIEQLLVENDLEHLAQQSYLKLSGGEKQRCHFARVLAQLHAGEPSDKILLLDEPTSSLDIAHQHQLMRKAKALGQSGAAVISIVHDLNLAARYCQRLVLLHQGRIIADGSPSHVLNTANIEQAYGYRATIHQHPQLGYLMVT